MHRNEPWVVVGEHVNPWGEAARVGLPLRDLTTHLCVSGSTGSGKSTFLRGLARQVFALGGVAIVIEPHGDLILDPDEGLLADLPPEWLDRVAVLDFAGPCPPQLNLAALDLGRGRSVAVDTAMACIEVVEASGWESGVRLREILEHTLHLILALEQARGSMLDVQRFLMDERWRERMLERMAAGGIERETGESLPYLRQLLAVVESAKQRPYGEHPLQYPLRRVGRFFRNDYLRRSLSLPLLDPAHALDLDRLLHDGRGALILVPLQARNLGHDAKRVIATLLMQILANLFLARADLARSARPQTLVILDEFSDLAGTGVGPVVQTLLAQARKYGASIVLATQSLAQLPREVQTEVRINTNNKIVLRPADPEDARAGIATLGTPLLKDHDLLNMERWCGYARLLVHGEPQPPFYFRTLSPAPVPRPESRSLSRSLPEPPVPSQLARIRQLVEAEPGKATGALNVLFGLSDSEFEEVVRAQRDAQTREAEALLAAPEMEPDPVARALRVSRARFGLPWWLYEAQYRRLRFGEG